MMLPKAHLTSHSRMSGSSWAITPLWLSGLLRSFLYSSSVYSCHLFFISSVVWISNQSILKEISPEYSLVGLMLKLKLQYFGHLMRRVDSFEKTLMLGKIEGRRRRGWGWDGWMASPAQWTWVWVNSGSWWWTGRPGVLWFMGSQRVRHDWVTELNWIPASNVLWFSFSQPCFLSPGLA